MSKSESEVYILYYKGWGRLWTPLVALSWREAIPSLAAGPANHPEPALAVWSRKVLLARFGTNHLAGWRAQ
ncbi:hypothetical protein BRAO375_960054 [Bradyrhizobium sp. ORS 375]|nr:hypothetical protein BRAO375_960054 [Bradyrhizobium sp. ORS 375]